MASINGLYKMSDAELLKLQEPLLPPLLRSGSRTLPETKEQLRAMAEKAGFSLNYLSENVARRKGSAKPNFATRKTLRRPGRAAVASRTGWWMP